MLFADALRLCEAVPSIRKIHILEAEADEISSIATAHTNNVMNLSLTVFIFSNEDARHFKGTALYKGLRNSFPRLRKLRVEISVAELAEGAIVELIRRNTFIDNCRAAYVEHKLDARIEGELVDAEGDPTEVSG